MGYNKLLCDSNGNKYNGNLTEIYDNLKFIIKDYFNEFEKENGKWPDFIKNWNILKKIEKNYQ